MKISTRLLLLFLLLAVLPLALFAYFTFQLGEKTLRLKTLEHVSTLADKKASQVQSYLTERKTNAGLLAHAPGIIGELSRLQTAYTAGRSSAAYRTEEARMHHFFERYVGNEHLFYDAFLITPQGEIVFSQKHGPDFATNLITGPYRDSQLGQAFRASRTTLEPAVSSFEFYAPSNQPAAFIVAPIMRDGIFAGVLALQLPTTKIYEVAEDRLGMGVSGETVLSRMLDPQHAMYIAPLNRKVELELFKARDIEKVPFIMRQALSGMPGSGVEKDYRGIGVAAAWRYLPELNWGMVVKIDAEEVFEPLAKQRMLLFGTLAGLLLLSGLAAFYFGRQISRPLRELVKVADQVSQGGWRRRMDESSPGELGLVARAFNHMTENLQELYLTLENRIEERTRELNVTNEQLQEEIIERERIEINLLDANEGLKHSKIMLNEAQRLGQLGSWELNLVSGELFWSDEIYRIFELDPAQFKPSYENFLNAIHPDDRDKVNQAYTQSLQDRQPYDVIHRLALADGRIKWVREHCSSDFDADGKPVRSVGAVQDITKQKLNEDSLRIAATTFETHEGIMITDAQSNILRVNKAFQEITGFSAEEVLGQTPRVLSSGRQGNEFYAAMWRQLLDSGTWSGEIWDRRKNGEIYPKWLTITAVRNEEGTATEYVAIFGDITERKRAEEEIRNLAFYDALTGLPNRRLLMDRFHLALSVSARNNHCGAVLFLDMDKFKTLNDTLGHDYGDLMLIEVARRIQTCVRESDTVARLGGDEFVILIEDIAANLQESSQRVSLIAEKIRSLLAEPYLLKEDEYHSSPSIGVSMYCADAESMETLMKQADLAMYQAKDSGRNAVRFFDPAMQIAVEVRAALEADLRKALVSQQLALHYQIQVDSEHRPIGAEALIRWKHPERGMIPPVQFIPLAEESSLILDIGNWVIDTACCQLAAWAHNEQLRYLTIAINVSAQQFRAHDFVENLKEIIVRHGVAPGHLKLELTESVVLTDVAAVVAKMHALKALGVRLSLDDFGTGYSSLSYLKQLPLDQLKIDQSFVRDVISDPNDAVMVKTIISMALNFRLNVIAEGVETEAQLAFLKENECLAYQGYLFSKPVPIAEFEALARRLHG